MPFDFGFKLNSTHRLSFFFSFFLSCCFDHLILGKCLCLCCPGHCKHFNTPHSCFLSLILYKLRGCHPPHDSPASRHSRPSAHAKSQPLKPYFSDDNCSINCLYPCESPLLFLSRSRHRGNKAQRETLRPYFWRHYEVSKGIFWQVMPLM